jgi:hypothetical protein
LPKKWKILKSLFVLKRYSIQHILSDIQSFLTRNFVHVANGNSWKWDVVRWVAGSWKKLLFISFNFLWNIIILSMIVVVGVFEFHSQDIFRSKIAVIDAISVNNNQRPLKSLMDF